MAGYGRGSTRRQKADSPKADLQRWRTGHAVPPTAVPWFDDVDRGTPLPRPACDRLPQGLFLGPLTPGVGGKLDRMARRQREGSQLRAEGWERGGRVVVLPPQLARRGAGGRLVAGVRGGRAAIAHA